MITPKGVFLVTTQEFRVRLRTGRWRWLLGAWVLLLLIVMLGLDNSFSASYGYVDDQSRRGIPLFGTLMLFVLGMVLVISPTLTSQTINGDRERGTLATLQVTRLRPGEIAAGKLLAGWAVGLVALALTLPFTFWAMAEGGVPIGRVAAVYGIAALLMGCVCAISLGYSAVLARSLTSTLLSYLTVGALAIGTLIANVLATPLTSEDVVAQTPDGYSYTYPVTHPEDVWWLLAPNPFVVLADAAPRVPPITRRNGDVVYVDENDPLSLLANEVRSLRVPRSSGIVDMSASGRDAGPVWPWGLGFDILVGFGAIVVATNRLRTPTRRLSRGVRIA
jgi:ABC-type transport system involved in multi-copper enzyme maturation permease subunit